MIYLCSDWHLNHDRTFIYKARGFDSVNEMNAEIVKRHNAVVKSEDDVYCLGDCCMGADLEANKKLIESLNGKIHIILGNHCHASPRRVVMYQQCHNVVEVVASAMIKLGKQQFYLSHWPTITSNNDADKPLAARLINLCGHLHTYDPWTDIDKGLIYHVEMEAHNCSPMLLDDILQEFKDKEPWLK